MPSRASSEHPRLTAGRTDARFLTPEPAGSCIALGSASEWLADLDSFGLVPPDDGPPDLAICDHGTAGDAIASGARSLIVVGHAPSRPLRREGFVSATYAAVPDPHRVSAFVPLGEPSAARFTLGDWLAPGVGWKLMRNRTFASLIGRGLVPPGRAITVANRSDAPPWPVAAAISQFDLAPDQSWVLAPAQGDRLSRGIFILIGKRAQRASHVVKYARIPDWSEPFELDQRGITLLDASSARVRSHVPSILGRMTVSGHHLSVETAAPGRRLIGFLGSRVPAGHKEEVIDDIVDWIVELSISTAAGTVTTTPEWSRVRAEEWPHGSGPDPDHLASTLSDVPAVVLHNDMGTWNITASGAREEFTVLDWESTRNGFPLWDLWYFLMDAEAQIAGAQTLPEREQHFADLFSGRLASSSRLFQRTRQLADALRLPPETIGPIASLCWVDHGLSLRRRQDELRRSCKTEESPFWLRLMNRISRRWLTDPRLGWGWPSFPGEDAQVSRNL